MSTHQRAFHSNLPDWQFTKHPTYYLWMFATWMKYPQHTRDIEFWEKCRQFVLDPTRYQDFFEWLVDQ